MAIAIPDSAVIDRLDGDNRQPGVMLSFDETTYRTMFDALDALESAKGRLGEIRDIIYSTQAVRELSLAPMTFPYLNASQQRG